MNHKSLTKWLPITLALPLLSLACAQKLDESSVKTADLIASYSLIGYPNSTSVSCYAYFTRSSDYQAVTLGADDVLTCDGEVMVKNGSGYYANLQGQAGKTYTISLIRPGESTHVANVSVPFAPTAFQPSDVSVTKGQALTVTWAPSSDSADAMEAYFMNDLSGNSLLYSWAVDSAPESGVLLFPASETNVIPPVAGTWNTTLVLTRVRAGTMPTGLQGEIEGRVSEFAEFQMVD